MKSKQFNQMAALLAFLGNTAALWAQQQTTTEVGEIRVDGPVNTANTGLILPEETPKARSSVTKTHLEKQNPANNPFQAIQLLPGVNTFSQDATGLFGGGVRVRGFAGDQMGFTVNGAPVNDSGSFAVFPQEYTDSENLCEVFVTQGSTDTEAPHVGASGGNVGMVTCGPPDQFRVRLQQSLGQLSYSRTFVRLDTGKLFDNTVKAFISYSKSQVDKFKRPGEADREHWDMALEYKPNSALSMSTSLLYNEAINNNYRRLTLAQIASFGRQLDFSDAAPRHLAPGRGAQVETIPADGYYRFNLNPFKNALWTGKVGYQVNQNVRFSLEPYFWYGYGTGGSQLAALAEGSGSNRLGYGVLDINGDNDRLDTVLVYRSSLTQTYRPGATVKANFNVGSHQMMVGYWYERARHFQTAPAVRIDNEGNAADLWLQNDEQYLRRQDGSAYQNRDWRTISTAQSLFWQDSLNLLDDRMNLQLGLRQSSIERDFSNYANEASTAVNGRSDGDYQLSKSYRKLLPSVGVRYGLDAQQSVFFNIAQNFRAPSNFVFSNLLQGGKVINGVLTGATLRQPKVAMETSNNFDLGYRLTTENLTLSGSFFYVNFKNRIARAFDVDNNITTDFNVGNAQMKGLEFESGYRLNPQWSLYGSLSYTDSKMKSDLQNANPPAPAEQTAGKQFPDTPKWLAAASLNYASGPWIGSLQAKYTGKAYSTLVNDETMAAYTVFNAALGYRFAAMGLFKNPELRFNIDNIFNKEYLRIDTPSGSSFTVRAQGQGGVAPSYFISAPRFASVTFRVDF